MKRLFFLIFISLLGCVAFLMYITGSIYFYAQKSDPDDADVAIVLGAAAWDARPSPVLRERVNHAILLYKRKQVKTLIFTGGKGKGATYAESEVAAKYAMEQGVPRRAIRLETVSLTTYENLSEAHRLVKDQNLQRVLIVSDPLHSKRAVTIARDLGMDAFPSPTRTSRFKTWKTKQNFLKHEVYTYVAYLLFGSIQNK